MFAFIRGRLITATPLLCILDVQGVGYKLFIPTSALGQLSAIGGEQLLYCSFVVRELSQALYGFLTVEERDLFELLMSVTGVGPKMALAIIGHLSPSQLQKIVASGDTVSLSKIPGIGKKTAERLLIEMRDKLKGFGAFEMESLAVQLPHRQLAADAMSAMIHLGYTQAVAQKAIKKSLESLPNNPDLATLITVTLKNI